MRLIKWGYLNARVAIWHAKGPEFSLWWCMCACTRAHTHTHIDPHTKQMGPEAHFTLLESTE